MSTNNFTLIKNARVMKEDCSGYVDGKMILIKDNQIDAISTDFPTNLHANIIDADNKVVMPGLIDAHSHITGLNLTPKNRDASDEEITVYAEQYLKNTLLSGFTTIREAGGADYPIVKLLRSGKIIGPRAYISGKALTMTGGGADFRNLEEVNDPCGCIGPHSVLSKIADGVPEVTKAVREELRKGANQIKVFVSGGVVFPSAAHATQYEYSLEELKAIVREASARNTYVMAHAYSDESVKMALEAGVRSIEHANFIKEETMMLMAQKDVYYDPTFISLIQRVETAQKENLSPSIVENLKHTIERGKEVYQWAKKYRVPILLGTDLWGPDAQPYQVREISERAQFDSLQNIITSATLNNAKVLGEDGKLGVIKEGAYADLLIVAGDPLSDPELFQNKNNLSLIMVNGIIHKNILESMTIDLEHS
ncbi:metal-dependent hydrolase family protein [Cysteiniphilum halobium]|uniref:metal-dependent hydrolase family protein n=1 Tax=Cysteiniphilum halobium TaxID=2219059 RepID=UPI001AAD3990|nr:amidohydrolase family protein [Cysteiniphilum halobium]